MNSRKDPNTELIGFTVSTSVGNLTGWDYLYHIQPEEARKVRSIPEIGILPVAYHSVSPFCRTASLGDHTFAWRSHILAPQLNTGHF